MVRVTGVLVIPSGLHVMPSRRWSTVVVTSMSSRWVRLLNCGREGQRHALAGDFELAFDIEPVLAGIGHAGRAKTHLRMVLGVEEVGGP